MTEQSSLTFRPATVADLPTILDLLAEAKLPVAEVEEYLSDFFVAQAGDSVIGCAGLEMHGAAGLVRSVAVAPAWRGRKVAEQLYKLLVDRAREQGLRELALLTIDAQAYFARFGFKPVSREEIDPDLLESAQFKSICPASAICMRLPLGCKPVGMKLSR